MLQNYLSNRVFLKRKSLKFSGDFAKIIASSFLIFYGERASKKRKKRTAQFRREKEWRTLDLTQHKRANKNGGKKETFYANFISQFYSNQTPICTL